MNGLEHQRDEPYPFLPKTPTERPGPYRPAASTSDALNKARCMQRQEQRIAPLPARCRIAARLCWLCSAKSPAAMVNPP
ncbi:hypothetical protein PgNI_05407 [Pyricularia grisea]|uniref:Uncharacterized protein n=1 Tax=Pyricularia grisea TaxID=148305 RepID=A0A6P8B661_PYRGI|nr:hypothetical protein PgNI_05407 [Pyricularia grisea]TLD10836.1 hypothetical protein PgNI_05407 [Pyricularia grisea]